MNQYRMEVDKVTGHVLKCFRAYFVGDDGVIDAGDRLIIRRRAESEAEARALAMFDLYKYKKGES